MRPWLKRALIGLALAAVVTGGAVEADPAWRAQAYHMLLRVVTKARDLVDPPVPVGALESELFEESTATVIVTRDVPNPATVVVFVDYNCPSCRRQFAEFGTLASRGLGYRVLVRHLPIFPESIDIALALLAARLQGGEAALHQVLIAADRRVGREDLPILVEAAGLDLTRLLADMARPEMEATLDGDLKLAWKLRVKSTPTLIVAGVLHRGVQDADALLALTKGTLPAPAAP